MQLTLNWQSFLGIRSFPELFQYFSSLKQPTWAVNSQQVAPLLDDVSLFMMDQYFFFFHHNSCVKICYGSLLLGLLVILSRAMDLDPMDPIDAASHYCHAYVLPGCLLSVCFVNCWSCMPSWWALLENCQCFTWIRSEPNFHLFPIKMHVAAWMPPSTSGLSSALL